VEYEMAESKKVLEENLQIPISIYSYPNGDKTAAAVKAAEKTGYKLCFTTEPECVGPGVNPLLIPRIDPGKSIAGFAQQYFWKKP